MGRANERRHRYDWIDLDAESALRRNRIPFTLLPRREVCVQWNGREAHGLRPNGRGWMEHVVVLPDGTRLSEDASMLRYAGDDNYGPTEIMRTQDRSRTRRGREAPVTDAAYDRTSSKGGTVLT